MQSLIIVLVAVVGDWRWGQPPRHPLQLFDRWTEFWERWIYGDYRQARHYRWRGIAALVLCLLPPTLLAVYLYRWPWLAHSLDLVVLYLALQGHRLHQLGLQISLALEARDLDQARALIVPWGTRDTSRLDEEQLSLATVETLLARSQDSWFAPLFWFWVAGAPGILLVRLLARLDERWGHPTPRYFRFGWATARLDDLLSWPSARLAALSLTLVSRPIAAWRCWHRQGRRWPSVILGPVLAAGAGGLGLQLGGTTHYFGQPIRHPDLGEGLLPRREDIQRTLRLLRRAVILWWVVPAGIWLTIEWSA